uniref:SAM domain-containing protein n=1 Tax=Panagrolaimus sp. JU765 TaxID=591449 RepID=A0AC34QK63_9BILA
MSAKERSVRFSTKKPVEHESFDYGDDGNAEFEKIISFPLPSVMSDDKFDTLDIFTAATLGWEYVEHLAAHSNMNPVEKNASNWTPLMYAAYLGHLNVCELLCSKGAQLEATNDLGQTPLMLAASCGSKEIVIYLVSKGSNVNKQDSCGQSALHYATRYNQSGITEVLVKAGGDPNLPDSVGMTPTLNACKVGNDATVSLLLKYKGDPNMTNNSGENGEALAADQPNVLKVLQSRLTINDLLKQLGLEKYIPIFEKNEITLNLFLKLTEHDLSEMGITLFGPKKKLMNVIKHYQQHGVIATEQDVVIPLTQPRIENGKHPEVEAPFEYRQEIVNVNELPHTFSEITISSPKRSTVTLPSSDFTEQLGINVEIRKLLVLIEKQGGQYSNQCHDLVHRLDHLMERFKIIVANQE